MSASANRTALLQRGAEVVRVRVGVAQLIGDGLAGHRPPVDEEQVAT